MAILCGASIKKHAEMTHARAAVVKKQNNVKSSCTTFKTKTMYEELTDIVTRLEMLSDEVMQITSANIAHKRTTFNMKLIYVTQKIEALQINAQLMQKIYTASSNMSEVLQSACSYFSVKPEQMQTNIIKIKQLVDIRDVIINTIHNRFSHLSPVEISEFMKCNKATVYVAFTKLENDHVLRKKYDMFNYFIQ